jgi:membrane peptidoglycan carboxypeptidase
VPAIRAFQRVGTDAISARATKFGIRFAGGTKLFKQAGPAAALGTVEVTPLDLTRPMARSPTAARACRRG